MKLRRRPAPEISISFLDVISCGFGAIVLLMLIAKTVEFSAVEEGEPEQHNLVALQEQLFELRGDQKVLHRDLISKQQQLTDLQLRISRLQAQLASVNKQLDKDAQPDTTESDQMALALQILQEEMARLSAKQPTKDNQLIGGIPVDSEYIVFIIDTSGSMVEFAWSRVRQEMINILDIYPEVKGIQIMNDMGAYMFPSYRGKWIPDTTNIRTSIISGLNTWSAYSNSSPVEGIQSAIKTFYAPGKKVSLYVFGDDFSGGSIHRVVKTVDQLNATRRSNNRLVRIHTVGFPVHFASGGNPKRAGRFAALMRELSYRNGGTFVGLNSLN